MKPYLIYQFDQMENILIGGIKMIEKKSSDFRGKERCNKLREHEGYVFSTEKNLAFDKAILVKDIIKGWFKGEFEVNEFSELVDEGLEDNYETQETGRLAKKQLVDCLKRYALCEKRTPLSYGVSKHFVVGDYNIKVTPDVIFDDGKEIEVVLFRNKKPDLSYKGRSSDTAVKDSIELYLMVLYGRTMIPAGQSRIVKGSYYFLRKDTDTKSKPFDPDFFSGDGGNVVSLEDEAYIGGSDSKTELDKHFEDVFKEFVEGVEKCNEESCKTCALYSACYYQKTPVPYEAKNIDSKGVKKVYSDAQLKIINFRKGICRVNATAGSGKTECMTERVTRMFEEGVKPADVLCITFTDAGALEMKERIAAKSKERGLDILPGDIKAMTFNAFANEMLQENYDKLGFTSKPKVADLDKVSPAVCLANLLDEYNIAGLDYKNFTMCNKGVKGALACAQKVVDIIKTNDFDVNASDIEDMVTEKVKEAGWYRFIPDNAIRSLIDLYKDFNKILIDQNLIYFSDQEPYMYKLFRLEPEYLENYGFKHIIVDEFQDSNTVQLNTIAKLIQCSTFESLMVVGDDSQAIYGFRNTSQENIIHFFEKLGVKGEDLYLTENRRSDPAILELANKLNDLNKEKIDKKMLPIREHQYKPFVRGFHTVDTEYDFIVSSIKTLINEKGYLPEDIAFIAATGQELVNMASKLSAEGIPWIMKNPILLAANSRVQAAQALAEAFYQPECENLYFTYLIAKHDGDIFEVPVEEIKADIAQLRYEFENMDNLEIPVQQKLFHDKLDALKCNDEIYDYFLSLVYAQEDFMSELQYFRNFKKFGQTSAKKMEQAYAGVVLTTAHSSKGLEWKAVFNSVSKYDSQPLHFGRKKEKEIEEKRRLLFVSMTRARDILVVTGQFIAFGSAKTNDITPNQFLRELYSIEGLRFDITEPEAIATARKVVKAAKKGKVKSGMDKNGTTYYTDEEIKELEGIVKENDTIDLFKYI